MNQRWIVEDIESVEASWGDMYVANLRLYMPRETRDIGPEVLYRIGPCYSIKDLLQKVLDETTGEGR
jgi:hypothetical protein